MILKSLILATTTASLSLSSRRPPINKMEKRERAVCGTLCLCLAVAVMSAVALVYLTVIIYIPTQREMTSGINEVPVMCTTTERMVIKDDILACRWSSCSEWCQSKGGGACTHLYVRQVSWPSLLLHVAQWNFFQAFISSWNIQSWI